MPEDRIKSRGHSSKIRAIAGGLASFRARRENSPEQLATAVPYGAGFTEPRAPVKGSGTGTACNEALQVIAASGVERFVQGPHPDAQRNGDIVFHWYEMCDAVQSDTYWLDGVGVSNFVLPL